MTAVPPLDGNRIPLRQDIAPVEAVSDRLNAEAVGEWAMPISGWHSTIACRRGALR